MVRVDGIPWYIPHYWTKYRGTKIVGKTVIKPTMEQSVGRSERKTRTDCIAEMRMLRWIRGKTRKDPCHIQDDATVCQMSAFLRQKRLN